MINVQANSTPVAVINNEIVISVGARGAQGAAGHTIPAGGNFFASVPINATIIIVPYALYSFTINQLFALATSSGSIVLAVNINGVPVTGLSALTVNSTSQEPEATALNLVEIGDEVTVVLSSAIIPLDLRFSMGATLII